MSGGGFVNRNVGFMTNGERDYIVLSVESAIRLGLADILAVTEPARARWRESDDDDVAAVPSVEVPSRERPAAVYRFYDAEHRLLYVGKSVVPDQRRKQHQRRAWWPDVVNESRVWYPSERAALDAEDRAILHERPIINRIESSR